MKKDSHYYSWVLIVRNYQIAGIRIALAGMLFDRLVAGRDTFDIDSGASTESIPVIIATIAMCVTH